ncbi:hypothetical protein NPIL_527331, partial [Nephila pilipes]
YYYSRDT